jgi:uncharacterized protein with PQ loop repeat
MKQAILTIMKLTTIYMPQQNSIYKRKNHTTINMMQSL